MDALVRLSAGAPAAALLVAAILVFSALGLFVRPALIERNLLRPYGLVLLGILRVANNGGQNGAEVRP